MTVAKNAVDGRGEVATALGWDGFADYTIVSPHCLRVYLEKSYRESLDLLSKNIKNLSEFTLNAAGLPHHSTLVKAFERIKIVIWRVLLRLSSFAKAQIFRSRQW